MKIALKIENSLICARAEMVARENAVARQHDSFYAWLSSTPPSLHV